jgi:hypothetical protein
MKHSILALVILLMAGCQICKTPTYVRKPDSPDAWNTNYLLDADPTTVSTSDLHARASTLDTHYWQYSQVEGVLWPAWRSDPALTNPDRWINGGDSGIYTGQALAAFCFKYATLKTPAALENVAETLRGLFLLTHGSGTPGVVQRNALLTSRAAEFGFPWLGRDPRFVNTGPVLNDPYGGGPIGPYSYYSRGTKDQLTGMILGLATTWSLLDPDDTPPALLPRVVQVRALAKRIAEALHSHLNAHEWWIRDENGKNDTGADYVDHLLRACVLGLVVNMGNTGFQEEYDKTFDGFIDLTNTLAYGDRFSNYSQYYAHNLRTSRALTLWLLEGANSTKGQSIAGYMQRNVWRFVKGHRSAWFAFVRAAFQPADTAAISEGLYSLRSLSLKPIRMWSSPYHGQKQAPNLIASQICISRYILDPHLRKPEDYTTWQKRPWDVGSGEDWDKEGLGDSSGLDYMLPYWMGRFFGLL